jgi:hypothetical protein
MDGINPTLAFAALFFGLSSNAHHASQTPAQLELQDEIDCPALVISGDPAPSPTQQTLAEAFEINLPDIAGSDAPAASKTIKPDPIMRQVVPVASNLPAADPEPDPCALER